ncbi:MAG: autotransporter-associated beta strand repeat-containing protein [Lentisphaerae bacterium]|nr:autotransporter-associated beta strand repeat-containing protein [Lentisphaerota bacterium]
MRRPSAAFRQHLLAVVFGTTLALQQAQAVSQYWNGAGTWNAANTWSQVSGGPYTSTWTNGNDAQFNVPASTITGATVTFTNITATENVTFTAGGTLGTGGTVGSITVASGKLLDLNSQQLSTAAGTGFIKNGPGALGSGLGTFTNGFTLNAGYIILRSVNGMGSSATYNPLTINGGAIGAASTMNLSGKYGVGITVGGHFQLGVLSSDVSIASSTANITFSDPVNLGAATRTITIGGNGGYTNAGVISGGAGVGLTIDKLPGVTGQIVLSSTHTYSGDTTVNGGILRVGTGGHTIPNGPGKGNVIVASGAMLDINSSEIINGLSGAGTIDNSNASSRDFTIGDNSGGGTFSGVIQNSGGALSLIKTNNAGTITLSGTSSTYTGKTSVQGGVLEFASLTTVGGGASSLGAPASTANGAIPVGEFAIGATLRYIGTGNANSNRRIDLNGVTGGTTLEVANSGNLTLSTALGVPVDGVKTLTLGGSSSGIGTISGVISNSANGNTAVTKTGSGTWVISGANTYSNDTTISAGTLRLGAAGTLPDGAGYGNVSVTGTLDLNAFSEVINGLSGGGTVDTVAGGSPTLTVGNNDQSSTFSGVLQNSAGSLALTKTGTGTLTLSGANTHSGNTTVSTGTLNVSHSLALQNTTVVSGGTGIVFDQSVGTHAFTFGGLSGSTDLALQDNGGNPVALTVGSNGVNTTYSGIMSLGGSLTKIGTGTNSLSGSNSYTGPTAIHDGAIAIVSASDRLPIGTVLTLGSGANSGKLILGNGAVPRSQEVGGLTVSGSGLNNAVVGGAPGLATLTVNVASGTSTFNGNLGGGAANENSLNLTKTGAGTFVIGGANTYTGTTAVSVGTLRLGADNVIPDGAAIANVTVSGGATLDLGGFSDTINGLSSSGTIDNTLGAGTYTLTVGNNDQSSSFGGLIQNTSGTLALTKTGTGTFNLSGSHTYSGDTTVSTGTLQIGAGGHTIPNGAGKGNVSVAAGATLDIFNSEMLNGLSGAGTITNSSSSSRVLTVGDNNGGGTFSGVIRNNAGVTLGLVKTNGIGTLTLSNTTSDYTGQSSVQGGVLEIASLANLGVACSLGAPSSTVNGAIGIGSGSTSATLRHMGGSASTSNRRLDIMGSTGGATLDVSGAGGLTLNGTVNIPVNGAKTLTLNASSSGVGTLSGIVSNSASGNTSLTKSGSGTWVVSGVNTYSGDTTVSLGTLRQGVASAIPGGVGKGNVAVNGTLDINTFSTTINGLSGNGTVDTVAGGSPTLSVGNNDQTSTFGGVITDTAGTLAVTKAGTGVLTLDGLNTYSGNTAVNAGTLRVNGSLATSPLTTVAAGGTLGGTGTVAALTVSGAVAPGASVGTLSAGSTTWAPSGTNVWEINDFGGAYGTDPGGDKLDITGTLNITATAGQPFKIQIVSLSGSSPGNAANFSTSSYYTQHIATVSGAISGFSPNVFTIDDSAFSNGTGGGAWSVEQNGSFIDIVFTGVQGAPLPPVATAATNVTSSSFYANWNAAAGAISYRLDVFKANEDFTDGDFTASPAWAGDVGSYGVLTAATVPTGSAATDGTYLGSAVAPSSSVFTASSEVSEWHISVGTPNWSMSDQNYLMVVLMASAPFYGDPSTNNFTGYYLRIGDSISGGGTDQIRLIRKTGVGNSETGLGIFPGSPSFSAGGLQNGLNIRVTRSAAGVFALYYSTGFVYTNPPNIFVGELTNGLVTTSSYFGLGTHLGGPAADRRVYLDNLVFGSSKNYVSGYQDLMVAPTTRQVSGLSVGASYFYEVRATNSFGTSSNSNTIAVDTLTVAPTATAATGIDYYGFTANWNALAGALRYRLDVMRPDEDFTDGDFSAYPAWSGNTADFEIISNANLPSGVAATDGAYLATKATAGDVTLTTPSTETSQWRFSLGSADWGATDLSSLNNFGVLLMSDTAISGPVDATSWNGYYLRVGTNNSPDRVMLFRRTGGSSTHIGDFNTPNFEADALKNGLNVRVLRSALGEFTLYYQAGFLGGLSPTNNAGTLTNTTHSTSSYFGVFMDNAGAAADRRVYIDNILLGDDNYVATYSNKIVTTTSDAVTNVAQQTDYMYQVRAELETGTTADSNVITVRTLTAPTVFMFK